MRPSRGQRCQQYNTHTDSACRILSPSEMFLYSQSHLLLHSPFLLIKLSKRKKNHPAWDCLNAPKHSIVKPLLPSAFAAFIFSPQRNSPSFGLPIRSREDWDSSWLWVPGRGRESLMPLRRSAWNCKVTVETAVFCLGQRCPCLEISHTESLLSLLPHRNRSQVRRLSHANSLLNRLLWWNAYCGKLSEDNSPQVFTNGTIRLGRMLRINMKLFWNGHCGTAFTTPFEKTTVLTIHCLISSYSLALSVARTLELF